VLVKEDTVPQQATVAEPKLKTRKRGRVRVFRNWCKGCGLCIAFCPRQVFTIDEDQHPVVAHPERCTGCEWCEIHCPDFAIVVQPFEDGSEAFK